LHEALERNKERLRRVLLTEACPVTVSGSQIESPIDEVKHWAEHAKNFEYLVDTGLHDTPMGPARRKIVNEPIGVVGVITPWNVPFYLNIAETVPALMAGNTVVLNPRSHAVVRRRTAASWPRRPDTPAGVFNVAVSNANDAASPLGRTAFDMITFTGSTATGRAIRRRRADGEEDAAGVMASQRTSCSMTPTSIPHSRWPR
jgi:acyl-CoA reductase-like NAD-dependent aldehyde dehydrogenase